MGPKPGGDLLALLTSTDETCKAGIRTTVQYVLLRTVSGGSFMGQEFGFTIQPSCYMQYYQISKCRVRDCPSKSHLSFAMMLNDGFRNDPFVASLLQLWRSWAIKRRPAFDLTGLCSF